MAEVQSISPADLRQIENNLRAIYQNIETLNGNISTVDDNVRVVYDEVGKLAEEFRDYVETAGRQHNLSVAEVRLVKIRQELESKYGHYAEVRRTTTGILQADDLGIVKKETISTATEELMLSSPNYWLAPCLVALSAWISDQPELAERALREGIRRSDEKTSLLFALICRRAGRKDACLKWVQRYLANQNEESLDRKCVIILDAFASGLLGSDSEGTVSRQLGDWLSRLAEKPGFIAQQTTQWSEAINLKRKPIPDGQYPYLEKYSRTWPVLSSIMEGANLHATMFDYLDGIFQQQASLSGLQEQLDEILTSLVSDFDDEELPLRRDELLNQLIVNFDGDLQRARTNMAVEESALDTHSDFTQLLTNAAMKPEVSHASISTQKFAIALSQDWITDAYNDVTAKNRMNIPNTIEINLDTFNDRTADGKDEAALVERFQNLVEQEKQNALAQCVLSTFEQYSLIGGGIIAVIGVIMWSFLGLIAIVAGVGLVLNHFSKKKKVEMSRQNITEKFDEKMENGTKILRALLAEVVDFRAEFQQKDAESKKVLDFLGQISPEQYVRKLSDSARRIKVAE